MATGAMASDTRTWLVAAGLAVLLHGAGVGALSRVRSAWLAPAPPLPVEFELRDPPPPAPPAPPEPPPPEPVPRVVEPPKLRPTVVVRRTPTPPPPVPQSPPPLPNQKPPPEAPTNAPPVFGVTMSSVVGGGDTAMAVPVGNTLMMKPSATRKTAEAPQPYPGGSEQAFRPAPEAYIATPARVLYEVNSADVYPPDALALGLEGSVNLSVDLNEKGTVVEVRILQRAGHKFDEAAVQALRRFRFSPARASDGRPVPTRITYRYRFTVSN